MIPIELDILNWKIANAEKFEQVDVDLNFCPLALGYRVMDGNYDLSFFHKKKHVQLLPKSRLMDVIMTIIRSSNKEASMKVIHGVLDNMFLEIYPVLKENKGKIHIVSDEVFCRQEDDCLFILCKFDESSNLTLISLAVICFLTTAYDELMKLNINLGRQ